MASWPKYPQKHVQWSDCPVCGLTTPVTYMKLDSKYGWLCTVKANCAENIRPDHDDYKAMRRFPLNEGARTTTAPPVQDQGDQVTGRPGYGESDYGDDYGDPV